MPIIKSAIKKMRKDKIRTARNKKREDNLRSLIKKVRAEKSGENLQAVFSALDKAVKVNLIHKNKANRLKSRLSKGVPSAVASTVSAKGGLASGQKKSAPKAPAKKTTK